MAEEQQASLPRHVLVIEDDDDVAYLIEALLVREGFEVALKRDGREALNTIRSELPADIVVCDLMLPHVDGFQLISEVRATPGWEHIPIVVLSSMNMEKHIVKALEAGANEYITKPFRPAEFVARLRRHLADKVDTINTVDSPEPVQPINNSPHEEVIANTAPITVPVATAGGKTQFAEPVAAVPNEASIPHQWFALARKQMGPLVMALAGIAVVVIAYIAGPDETKTVNMATTATAHAAPHVEAPPPPTGAAAAANITAPQSSSEPDGETTQPTDANSHGHHDHRDHSLNTSVPQSAS